MTKRTPLSTLLGQLVIAHTIEVDQLFEQRMPHSTTLRKQAGRRGEGPWLVSYVMWSNVLRHVEQSGTSVAELRTRAAQPPAALKSRLGGLTRWAYVTVEPPGPAPGARYDDHVVRLTAGGRTACEIFEELPEEVEGRWVDRFGRGVVTRLRDALTPFLADAPPDLPRFLPVVERWMRTEVVLSGADQQPQDHSLLTLLAQTLLLFTLQVESESAVSLPHLVNVLRVLEREPTGVREVPLRSGVSPEAVSAALTYLRKGAFVTVTGSGVASEVALTDAGADARAAGERRLRSVERAWAKRGDVTALRDACEAVLTQSFGPRSALAEGLRPPADAWRTHPRYARQTEALLADPRAALPHHPMVLHRGGYPDGS